MKLRRGRYLHTEQPDLTKNKLFLCQIMEGGGGDRMKGETVPQIKVEG